MIEIVMKGQRQNETETGNTLITVAISLIALFAMLALVIDLGLAYAERRKMQNAADAGALAGGAVLVSGGSDAQIEATVQQYTSENGAQTFQAFYTPSGQQVGTGYKPADATGVQVVAEVTFPTIFAGLVGLNTINVQATAEGGYAPLDIVLVMDRSGSMDDDSHCSKSQWWCQDRRYCTSWWCGGTWLIQPLTDAQIAARYFVDLNNPELSHIGLVSYSYQATKDRTLTDDFAAVKASISALIADGCTNAADGIQKAREELTGTRSRPHAARIIIFLTDGLPNYPQCSDCRDHCPSAKQATRTQAAIAADNNIVIYAIGLGSKADMALMQDIADLTGGEAFFAPSSGDLKAIYEEIFQQVRLRLTG